MGETAPLLILIGLHPEPVPRPVRKLDGGAAHHDQLGNLRAGWPAGRRPGVAAALTLVLIVMVLNLIARRIASRNRLK